MSSDSISWRSALRSDVGKVRTLNEDTGLDRPDLQLWSVADGMGGHSAGDLASQAIITSLANLKPNPSLSAHVEFVEHRIFDVNNRLYELSQSLNQTIGSTVVVLIAGRRHCVAMWAGDSRLYRLRAEALSQITTDHTQAEHYIEQGLISRAEAAGHPADNLVTRAVGASAQLFLDLEICEIEIGDRFLLCSDGLGKHVEDREVTEALRKNDPLEVVNYLVNLALHRGGTDNVTVCAVFAEWVCA